MNYVDDLLNDETIDINGETYTKEEVKEIIIETVQNVWSKIKSVVEYFMSIVTDFIEYISNINYVGFKRELKCDEIEYFESISDGKSNNWRKLHGLHVKRCIT